MVSAHPVTADGRECEFSRIPHCSHPLAAQAHFPALPAMDVGWHIAPRPTKTPLDERRFFTTGAVGRNRTGDLRITNALLYQLSYNGEKQRAL